MRKKLNIYWFSILFVHVLLGKWFQEEFCDESLLKQLCLGFIGQEGTFGNHLSSPPFPRQLSTAVIPDTSLRKLLLNLPVIKLHIFLKQSLPVSSLFLLLEPLSSHLTHTLLILGLFHYYLHHLPRIMEDSFVQKPLIYFPSMLYLVTEIPNLFLLSS